MSPHETSLISGWIGAELRPSCATNTRQETPTSGAFVTRCVGVRGPVQRVGSPDPEAAQVHGRLSTRINHVVIAPLARRDQVPATTSRVVNRQPLDIVVQVSAVAHAIDGNRLSGAIRLGVKAPDSGIFLAGIEIPLPSSATQPSAASRRRSAHLYGVDFRSLSTSSTADLAIFSSDVRVGVAGHYAAIHAQPYTSIRSIARRGDVDELRVAGSMRKTASVSPRRLLATAISMCSSPSGKL